MALYYQCYNSVNGQKGGTAMAVPATPVPTALLYIYIYIYVTRYTKTMPIAQKKFFEL